MASLQAFSWQISNCFREQSQETFFFEYDFVKVRNSELQACSVKEKRVVLHKVLFEIFEILEHPFLFKHFQKSISSGVRSVGYRVWSYKFNKRKLSYIQFFWIISKVFDGANSKDSHEKICYGVQWKFRLLTIVLCLD